MSGTILTGPWPSSTRAIPDETGSDTCDVLEAARLPVDACTAAMLASLAFIAVCGVMWASL